MAKPDFPRTFVEFVRRFPIICGIVAVPSGLTVVAFNIVHHAWWQTGVSLACVVLNALLLRWWWRLYRAEARANDASRTQKD